MSRQLAMLDALSDAASSGSAPLHDDTRTGDAVGDRTDNRCEDELGALSNVGSRGSSRSNCIDALSDHDVDVAPSRQERRIHGIDEARGVSRPGDGLRRYNASKRQRVTGDVLRQRLTLSGKEWRKFKNLRRNAERQKQRQNAAAVKTHRKLKVVCSIWNKRALRRGERLHADDKPRSTGRGSGTAIHPRAWTTRGAILLGFTSIGALASNRSSQQATRRSLDAIAAVALAAIHYKRESCQMWRVALSHKLHQDGPQWVCVARAFDATPLRVAFGAMSDLAQIARYWRLSSQMQRARRFSHQWSKFFQNYVWTKYLSWRLMWTLSSSPWALIWPHLVAAPNRNLLSG